MGKESSEKFLRAVKANEKDLEDLTDPSVVCPEDLREQFTKTVLGISHSAGINKRGRKKPNSDQDPAWFDIECKLMKKKIRQQGKQLKREPYNKSVHTKLNEEKKNFKNLIRKKKMVYKKGVLHKMNLKKKNGKIFWKLLDKLDLNKADNFFVCF